MSVIPSIPWATIFSPDVPWLEIFVGGSAMYLGIFIILRVVLKREAGSIGTTDILMVVMISDAAQNGMTGAYNSVGSGLFLVSTLIFWDYFLDFLSFKSPWLETLINGKAVPLIENGKINIRNLKKERISSFELESMLRQQGVSEIKLVKKAMIESNGEFSVVKIAESND